LRRDFKLGVLPERQFSDILGHLFLLGSELLKLLLNGGKMLLLGG
jgi:hypothetical protein